ncbi:P-loop containing nucleoside triphosphate hydrolase protein [Mucor lusitanicus]|uniref:AAA+ ATPase domain-containing protein n=2 Tax=Mucor circinelloides f. lusitanicus TaxID=29924 RepID=A0A162Y8N7_MUCCL|nr:P-loop containing nucleoside triphosphate hydrolase protein [Mucor lusitanicus]OAC97826.1 hypothetical protein MUCCIDRAFT_86821 [Mucor lusitanicus CBS 277.49]
MSSKQRSIKDHFKALKPSELAEREPNVYPLFRSKAIEKPAAKKPKSCKPKAIKIKPPQNTAAKAKPATTRKTAAAVACKTRAKSAIKQVDLTSVTAATESIRTGARSKQPAPSLNDMIAQDTHQFYLNQRKKREQAVDPSQQQQQQQRNQPVACPQRLDMKEIEHQMNTYHADSWKQDRCCKVLYDQIPQIRRNSTKKTMWRDKYRPNTVEGLLGYTPDYEYVRDWLNQIKIKSPTVPETSAATGAKIKKKPKQDEEAVYNLMLFVGDHGSGKTASVYTAAKETGYSVFEINSSSRRTGRDVTDSVGEMTESHLVRFTSNMNKRKAQGETIILRDTVRTKKPKTIDIAEHFKKMLSMQNGTQEPVEPAKPEAPAPPPPTAAAPPQNTLEAFFKKAKSKQDLVLQELANQPKQSLLLFEEVDILFDEDKGFWTAIIDLCQKSKRPIIMTCNDESKIPFDFFNIQCTVYLERATTEHDQARFVQYMQLLCYAENYSIPKREISYLCELLEYDTRQVIDMLQFWLNETPPTTGHFVYHHLFAHVVGLANDCCWTDRMQWMDHLKGCQSRVIELCTRYYDECVAAAGGGEEQQEVMRIEDLYQVMENAAFADAWVGLKDKHRHQLYDIDQYNAHQDGYHGNDTRVIYKDATDLDHWELGEIMDNSITVMNLATINKNNSWRNHLSAWSSHWEYLCNTRKLYSDDCLITCKHILSQHKEQRLDVILSDYMPAIRSLSQYDQGVAGKGRMVRTRKRLRYLPLTDESRDALNWQHTLV